jgi:hypothetical protein
MNNESKQYDGPLLYVSVDSVALGEHKYKWEVRMTAVNHGGTKKLGYRAEGLLNSLEQGPEEFPLLVHDENRPVWTTMPSSHRKDVRAAIKSLVASAIAVIKVSELHSLSN